MIRIKQGVDLPIAGAPHQQIDAATAATQVAILGPDFIGMKPTMAVQEGETVAAGQLLFTDKKNDGVRYTAPAAGKVSAINRGEKRALLSVVIDVAGDDAQYPTPPTLDQLSDSERTEVVDALNGAGLWSSFRTRPFSMVPRLADVPSSVFINAMDTNPLAADPAVIIASFSEDFVAGQEVVARLSGGRVFVVGAEGADIPKASAPYVESATFAGPHPAGLPGTHIHFLDPVSASKTVWTIGYQDVIAIGQFFRTGTPWLERVVALGGPPVNAPRLLRTRLGAAVPELVAGEVAEGNHRLISGSVLTGHTASSGALGFLGRYDTQVSVLPEDSSRHFIGYLSPGLRRHSAMPIYLSNLFKSVCNFTTTTHGSTRAMVPVGAYERVVPLDMLPTQLLRAVLVGDLENAVELGALELDEEDLALCTFVCHSKHEYGEALRATLDKIEKEG